MDNIDLKTTQTYLQLEKVIGDVEQVEVLTMAVGYIHDVLYENYDEYLTYNDVNQGDVDIRCTTEPDGICITFEELDFTIEVASLDESILQNLPLDNIDDEIIASIAVVIRDLHELMEEHGINPEECKEYQ